MQTAIADVLQSGVCVPRFMHFGLFVCLFWYFATSRWQASSTLSPYLQLVTREGEGCHMLPLRHISKWLPMLRHREAEHLEESALSVTDAIDCLGSLWLTGENSTAPPTQRAWPESFYTFYANHGCRGFVCGMCNSYKYNEDEAFLNKLKNLQ